MLLSANIPIDEDTLVPFELGLKYESLGLKFADAFIAAYAEYVGAEILVSENRHFLTRHHARLPFKICNAETCLNLIKATLKKWSSRPLNERSGFPVSISVAREAMWWANG